MKKDNSLSPLIEFRHIRKEFGPVIANADLNFFVKEANIHAIIGENGAGKSTAMKMLYGMYAPTEGQILLRGQICNFHSPHPAIAKGIGMVHQHFMLAGSHSVLDNILLGAEATPAFFPIKRKKAKEELCHIMEQYGILASLDALVGDLSVGEQQRVEILKILYRKSEILILDEPTAVLTPQEIKDLFANLRKMREQGKTILIITHKLKEVMALADKTTVFRAGNVVAEKVVKESSVEELSQLMVGRKVDLRVRVNAKPVPVIDNPVLEIKNLCVLSQGSKKAKIPKLNLNVRAGEIVGIAGVEGNGQSELIKAIIFAKEKKYRNSGSIIIDGINANNYTCEEIRKLGVSLLAENRLKESLLLLKTLLENYLLGHHQNEKFQNKGFLRWQNIKQETITALNEYNIHPRNPLNMVAELSGGNQQKLVVARELLHAPKLLIAAQPTRGVDIGAIESIHKKIFSLRNAGTGILLLSAELDEILALSDRILVMFNGEIVAEFTHEDADEVKIGFFMGGGKIGEAS